MAEGGGDVPLRKRIKLAPDAIPKLPEDTKNELRLALEALEDNIAFAFNLLKITYSNGEMCVPFSKTFIKIERSSRSESQTKAAQKTVYSFAGVFRKGVDVLKSYLDDPAYIPEDKEIVTALNRLAQTILKLEDIAHKLSKKQMSPDKKRETGWCINLVHHLLKELSVNKLYRIDVLSKFKRNSCSCCEEPIGDYGTYDDCSLGHSDVWHGTVDILLGPHPDVAVYATEDTDMDVDGSLSSFEVKDQIEMTDRTQIIAETIVFSFLQKKHNPSFDNYLIPTVGISKKDVLFYMYDPEHDILLESSSFNLFDGSQNLYCPTVLALWFTLNYKIFCTGITTTMKNRNFTADFMLHFKDDIKTIYETKLHFRDCGIGSIRDVHFNPLPGQGWHLDKAEPFKTFKLK